MELRHLRYFLAVAEELSFSKGAQRLRIAQPAISRTIKELEGRMGVELLTRTKRSVTLTPAGAVLLNEARLLLQRIDEAERRVRRTADGEEGELRLGYIGPPAQPFLGHIVKEYRRRYPRVSVVLEERTPERVWEMVARGRLSIGLTRPVFANRMFGLHTLLLRRERLCAVLAEGHPLAKARNLRWPDLADEPLIVLSRREAVSLHDAVLAAFRRARLVPRIAHTPSLISTVLNYVEAGAGIGIVSDSIASLGRGALLVFRPLSPAHTVDFVMVWSENDDTPAAASFRALIHEWLQKKLLWNPGPSATAPA